MESNLVLTLLSTSVAAMLSSNGISDGSRPRSEIGICIAGTRSEIIPENNPKLTGPKPPETASFRLFYAFNVFCGDKDKIQKKERVFGLVFLNQIR